MSRPHQERGEGDGHLVGLGSLVVAGRDATSLLEAVETPFHDVALLVEAGRASASAAAAGSVALLVGPLGNGVGDAAPPQPGAYRAGAVPLVAQHMSGPQPGPSRPKAGHPDRLHHGGELRAVVRVAARQHDAERAPRGIAGQVDLAGQAAPGASECGDAEPPFLAPTACWWARTTVESTDTTQSISPAASARAWAARSIRSNRTVHGDVSPDHDPLLKIN